MLKTNFERIKNDIINLSEFNSTPGNGVTRSSYSKEDKQAREYLIKEMEKIGLEIYEDGYKTLFGRKEGKLKEAPVVMIGSHYDSVVNGGAFDGAAGVVTALETMRVLIENGFENDYPIELIIMNAEEGETFGSGTGVSNSRAMVGTLTEGELKNAKNRHGQTKFEAMQEYGFTPDLKAAKRPEDSIKNFIELHIEQGPVLEKENIDLGLIEYLPGIGRFKARFYGESGDSTVPMSERRDALVAASKFVLEVEKLTRDHEESMAGGVGSLDISPNSNQFVPDFTEAFVELRTFKKEDIDVKEVMQSILSQIENETGVSTELEEIARIGYSNPTPPSVMDTENIEKMKDISDHFQYSYMIINNGTGHDAMIMTDFAPTNMIYVPSKNGISHDPAEWTDYEYLEKGADLLLNLTIDNATK